MLDYRDTFIKKVAVTTRLLVQTIMLAFSNYNTGLERRSRLSRWDNTLDISNVDYHSSLLRVGQVTVEIKLGFDPKLLLDSFVQKQITPCCTRLFANSPLTSSRTPGSILYNQYITQFYLCQSTFYLNILFIISVVITILSSAICHKSSWGG